ncbi:unnamed protein product [Caenorhabditis angaria]|uniref:Neurotransmitter-gated ion-channel ligand-binding domain-containing protein n=1 Tax=Caenorhabditis angaria TaxID=860376 RepID=A0A9P1MVX3_9PELO|nr:unnamed protein product [Caenorhabditis angaria]
MRPSKNLFPAQKRLYHDIFNDYDNKLAPIIYSETYKQSFFFSGYNKTIHGWIFKILINQIKVIDLDEPQELFTTSVDILVQWLDPRLMWNISEYEGIQLMYIRQSMIWSPPIGVFSASDLKDLRDLDFRIAKLQSRGLLEQYTTMRLTTNCGLNMANFPFDIQSCEIHLGLSGVHWRLYNISMVLPAIDDEFFCDMSNSAWTIVNVSIGTLRLNPIRDILYRIGVVRVILKRNATFYMYMIILPTFTINMIAIGGVFLKKSTKMEKLTIGFTHIMTMTFILGLVSEKIPKTSEIPLLGKYIVFGLCLMMFALVISTAFDKFCNTLENNRRFGDQKIIKTLCMYILHCLNILAISYMIHRFVLFENSYGTHRNCDLNNNEKNRSVYSDMSTDLYETFNSTTGF